MLSDIKLEAWEPRTILSALAYWAVSALVLLCIACFILTKISLGEAAMGYVSSALSFLSAVCAGAALGRARSGESDIPGPAHRRSTGDRSAHHRLYRGGLRPPGLGSIERGELYLYRLPLRFGIVQREKIQKP